MQNWAEMSSFCFRNVKMMLDRKPKILKTEVRQNLLHLRCFCSRGFMVNYLDVCSTYYAVKNTFGWKNRYRH